MILFSTRKNITKSILTIALGFTLTTSAYAGTENTEQKIRESFQNFSSILNEKSAPEELIKFLHESIKQDAEFKLVINNPQINSNASEETLTKADYINSFLYGPRTIQNYNMDIKVKNISKQDSGNKWISNVVYIESGDMKTNYSSAPGKPFTSITSCEVTHILEKSNPLLDSATCKTQILAEQDV